MEDVIIFDFTNHTVRRVHKNSAELRDIAPDSLDPPSSGGGPTPAPPPQDELDEPPPEDEVEPPPEGELDE